MTVDDLYRRVGGSYSEVLSRLRSEALIKKLIKMFPDDPGYSNLCIALKYGDTEGARLAAKSLLGVCKNLGFATLERIVSEIAAALEEGCGSVTDSMLSRLGSDYEVTAFLTQKFTNEN